MGKWPFKLVLGHRRKEINRDFTLANNSSRESNLKLISESNAHVTSAELTFSLASDYYELHLQLFV